MAFPMAVEEPSELEKRFGRLHAEERYQELATEALEAWGGELLGFLVALHHDEELGAESFSVFAEAFWRGLPNFENRSSLRTWAYVVARNAAHRAHRDRKTSWVALSSPEVARIEAKVRTETLPFLRGGLREGLAQLRADLNEDDRALLVLRVSRGQSWTDIARILGPSDEPEASEALTRRAAALRKRFQRLKEELQKKARARASDER
ncbi:MAG: sigma-70 family RNA polymerase sigma factor [Deltaproteobacteria bacterium]|nr:sigma-70 family RNA polymerase sigma factor [Deltaproteobacteria bacterium]